MRHTLGHGWLMRKTISQKGIALPVRWLKDISKEIRFGRIIWKRRWRGLQTVTGWNLVRCIWQNISMTWTQTNYGYIFRQ